MANEPRRSRAVLLIEFDDAAQSVSDVSVVLAALDRLLLASLWIEICDPDRQHLSAVRARDQLRNVVLGSRLDPELRVARLALFGEPYSDTEEYSHRAGLTRSDSLWALSRDAAYGEWLRRELSVFDPLLFQELVGFAAVEELQRESPLKLKVGVTGITTAAFLVAGPWGLAPAVLLGLYETTLWARERWWQSQERVAESKARVALSETTVIREQLIQSMYRTAQSRALPESAVEVALKLALPATVDLGTTDAISRLELSPPADEEGGENSSSPSQTP